MKLFNQEKSRANNHAKVIIPMKRLSKQIELRIW